MVLEITIEDALLKVGGYGRFQILVSVLLIASSFYAGIITFQFQSLAILPNIKCVSNRCSNLLDVEGVTKSELICRLRKGEWVFSGSKKNWATEFELYCDDLYLVSMGTTLYFTGFFFGVLVLSSFSDKYGRRITTLIFMLGYSVTLLMLKYSTLLNQVLVLRILCGVLHGGVSITMYVITCEFLHAKYTVIVNLISSISFSLGGSAAGYIAMVNDDWHACVNVPLFINTCVLFLFYYFCPETPFWLFAKGKELQAIVSLNEVASMNKARPLKGIMLVSPTLNSCGKTKKEDQSVKLLLFTPFLRTALLRFGVAWFTVAICYYALEFNAGALGSNEYLVMIIMGCTDFPFKIFIIVLAKKFGRQKACQWYFGACAVMLVTSAVPFMAYTYIYRSFTLKMVFVIFGRSFGGATFALLYTYTSEILPTLSRSTGMAFCSACARVGSLLSPFVLILNQFSPMAIYVLTVTCVVISMMLLCGIPETLDRPLPNNIRDCEVLFNVNKTNNNIEMKNLLNEELQSESDDI